MTSVRWGVAVGEIGGDVELAATTGLDPDEALVPTLDDLADAECLGKGTPPS
jgi:hypothetical protein